MCLRCIDTVGNYNSTKGPQVGRRKGMDHAAAIRQAVAALVEENERHRKAAGELRLAGFALVRYLQRLASGKVAGAIQADEVAAAIKTIREPWPPR